MKSDGHAFDSKLRLLILSCSGGAGHVRAGEALLAWSRRDFPGIDARHHDVLEFTSKTFRKLYAQSYLTMVQRAPELWGVMYARTERKTYKKPPFLRIFDHFNYKRYLDALDELAPDAVVCTHFLPFLAIENRIVKGSVKPPFFAVGTDFNLHALWVSNSVRHYFTFSQETSALLSARGIPAAAITPTGIPVMPDFAERRATSDARATLGIPPDKTTILVLSGGYGVGNVERIVGAVEEGCEAHTQKDVTVVVVCGRNLPLKARVERLSPRRGVTRHVVGFVENMQEFMFAADLIVTKSGGLTSSEALAVGVPMIVVDPIPGQERHNADTLVEGGAALIALDEAQLTFKVRFVLQNPTWLKKAGESAKGMGRPSAAKDILRHIENLMSRV